MKTFKSIISSLLLSIIFIPNTQASNELSFYAKDVKEIINGNEELKEKWVSKSKNDTFLEKALKSVHEFVEKENPEDITKTELLLIELLSTRYKIKNKWENKNNYISNPVWTNNNLVDLNRVELGTVNYPIIQGKYSNQYHLSEENRIINGQRLSSTLMRLGLAPIGPDAKPIKLCRLIHHKNASFFELSDNESKTFISKSLSGMNENQACINYPSALKKYWNKRLRDFYDKDKVTITGKYMNY